MPHNEDEVRCFWRLLVCGSILEDFVELNPVFEGQRLRVYGDPLANPEVYDKVQFLLAHTWQFRVMTWTRWLSLATCARTLVVAELLGLEQIIREIRAKPHTTDYHLHHYDRLTPDVRVCLACAAVSSVVVDSLVQDLMDDDRMALKYEEYHGNCVEEMSYIEQLSMSTWSRLSSITKCFSPVELRDAALHVSHTAFCFVDWRLFRKVRDYPWRLTRGDTLANLDQLVRDWYDGDDLPSQQLRDLHAAGYNTQRLLDTIDLIAQAPWSTGGLEQGHGAMAQTHRLHLEMSAKNVACRSTLSQARSLFQESADVATLRRLQSRLDRLGRKSP